MPTLSLVRKQQLHKVAIYISHLSIPKYYISRGITRIFSLPEGYKGKYDPYFPPSGYDLDQSEPLFSSHKQSYHHTYYMCVCISTVLLLIAPWLHTDYTVHRQ